MRNRVVLLAAFFLATACGSRTLLSGDATGGTSPTGSTPSDCVYGKIATVPGLPLGIASTGKIVFVVSADVGGVIGDLRAIASDGSVHLVIKDNAYIGMAVVGPTLAFSRRLFDNQQNLLSATIEIVNPDLTTTTTIDSTNTNVAQLDSLASSGTSLFWYRWPPPSQPFETTNEGTPAIVRYEAGSTTVEPIDSSALSPQGLVTDGTGFFSVFNLANDFGIVGQLPVNGESPIVLATSANSFSFQTVVGIDDADVIYLSEGNQAFAVPKNGGTSALIASNDTFTNSPALYDRHLYWAEQNADGSGSVSRVSTSGGAIETVASSTAPIPTLTTDPCGLLYATTDSAEPGLTAASIYRAKF